MISEYMETESKHSCRYIEVVGSGSTNEVGRSLEFRASYRISVDLLAGLGMYRAPWFVLMRITTAYRKGV
jgi:hypothetical protein